MNSNLWHSQKKVYLCELLWKASTLKPLDHYRIAFVGLVDGVHYFNYEIDDTFFDQFAESPVQKGKIFIDLSFEKRGRIFTLIFDLGGQLETECDRCSAHFMLPIHGHFKMFVKLGREQMPDEEDVIVLSPDETHLELGQLIYEFVNLSIPMFKSCEDAEGGELSCNPEVVKRINNGNDDDESTDPRWDALKSLK